MSRTMQRNGKRVEDFLRAAAGNETFGKYPVFTVGEVAELIGMSKPTVQKYVEILCESQLVEWVRKKDTGTLYIWCEGFYHGSN